MEFDTSAIDKYLVDLAQRQLLPLFQWMLSGLSILLAFWYGGNAVTRFMRAFAYQGGSAMEIRDRRNTVRSIFSSLFLAGAAASLGRVIVMGSDTFFIRRNTAFTFQDRGLTSNVNDGMDAILLILAGMGIWSYIKAGRSFDASMKGDDKEGKAVMPYLVAGIILTNMEAVAYIFKTTLKITI